EPIRNMKDIVFYPPDTWWDDLTLKQLLNMTSRLESYDNVPKWEDLYAAHPGEDMNLVMLLLLVAEHTRGPMSKHWYYSNTGYLIAQAIVEMKSPGTNGYAGAIQRITQSVGLDNTFYVGHSYPSWMADRIVSGYYVNDEKGLKPLYGQDVTRFSL